MRNIRIKIQYDGSRYLGWQRLSSSGLTIQGKLEEVISRMTGEQAAVVGSGRTDAGVHSRGQIANFKTNSTIPVTDMQVYINHYLPKDIVVSEIEDVEDRFHSRYNVKGKKYTYYISREEYQSPFVRKYSWHFTEQIDLNQMKIAASKLIGTHDFIGFSSVKNTKKSTKRRMDSIKIKEDGPHLIIEFVGEGFLHNMIRILTGTLMEIGTGRIPSERIDEIFTSGVRAEAGLTVPPHGLFLEEVYY